MDVYKKNLTNDIKYINNKNNMHYNQPWKKIVNQIVQQIKKTAGIQILELLLF